MDIDKSILKYFGHDPKVNQPFKGSSNQLNSIISNKSSSSPILTQEDQEFSESSNESPFSGEEQTQAPIYPKKKIHMNIKKSCYLIAIVALFLKLLLTILKTAQSFL